MTTDQVYVTLLSDLLARGETITTRNSQVKRLLAYQCSFTSTPLISIRATAWKNALREMEWFLSGSNDIRDLHQAVRPWWEPWASPLTRRIHNNYSRQFREFWGRYGIVDQIQMLLDGVKNHPFSRRNVITTWNTADMVDKTTLITNCHGSLIQVFVHPDDTLDLVMYQRSVDVVCGLPHNLIQYWALLLWLADHTGRKPGRFTWIGGDVHLYETHTNLARRMVERQGEVGVALVPDLAYLPSVDEFRADDFTLDGEYLPVIVERAEMVV